MSKELECLDRIDKRNYLTEREHKEFLGVVEKALTEYEAIKKQEPTKAMEFVEKDLKKVELAISRFMERSSLNIDESNFVKDLNEERTKLTIIKQALLKAEQDKKKARCWDIAMAKGLRVVADVITHKNYCDYIDYIKNYDKKLFNSEYRLTEEEFNTLKEIIRQYKKSR